MFMIRPTIRCTIHLAHLQNRFYLRHLSGFLNVLQNTNDLCKRPREMCIHGKVNVSQSNVNDNNKDNKQILGKIERKLKLTFTCKKCSTRNTKIISKVAYEKGIVIVKCSGCQNNHLIADNLQWFVDKNQCNIEKILKEKGETVTRTQYDSQGYFIIPKENSSNPEKNENSKEEQNINEEVNNNVPKKS